MLSSLLAVLLNFLRDAFTQNVALKSISLTFAVGLFAFLHGQQDIQQRTIPVDVVTLPPEDGASVLMTQIPPNIHVTLRASSRAIDTLIRTGVSPIEIDLRGPQKKKVEFTEEMFSLPQDLEVIIIDPPSIELEWQNVVSREIPLQAAITGQPASGYVLKGEPEVEPKMITARGPASVVEVMQFARLSAFDVSGLTEGVWPRRIAIDAPPARVGYEGPQSADVKVTIARRVSESKFAERPVEVVGVPGAVATPRTVDVTVFGAPEVVRALRAEQIIPRADVSTVKGLNLEKTPHGSASVRLTVDLNKAEAEIQPPSVTVKW
jgi:YbbR domain-containing protein